MIKNYVKLIGLNMEQQEKESNKIVNKCFEKLVIAEQKIEKLEIFKKDVINMQKDNYGNGSMTHLLLHKICRYEANQE